MCERVATHAPDAHGTKAQFTRLHDDKDTFTGAYGANLGIAARVREHRVWKEGRVKGSRDSRAARRSRAVGMCPNIRSIQHHPPRKKPRKVKMNIVDDWLWVQLNPDAMTSVVTAMPAILMVAKR